MKKYLTQKEINSIKKKQKIAYRNSRPQSGKEYYQSSFAVIMFTLGSAILSLLAIPLPFKIFLPLFIVWNLFWITRAFIKQSNAFTLDDEGL